MRAIVVGDSFLDIDVGVSASKSINGRYPADLDVVQEREGIGGAGLIARLLAERGVDVTLVTGWPRSELEQLVQLLPGLRISTLDADCSVPIRSRYVDLFSGEPIAQISDGTWTSRRESLGSSLVEPVGDRFDLSLVSDYGGICHSSPELVGDLFGRADPTRRVWDPHWSGAKVSRPTAMLMPNLAELDQGLTFPSDLRLIEDRARELMNTAQARHVVVTLGHLGSLLIDERPIVQWVRADVVSGCDPSGPGDFLTASVAANLALGIGAPDCVLDATRAVSAHLQTHGSARASGSTSLGFQPDMSATPNLDPVLEPVGLVAAGGCFDLLHDGHVYLLGVARQLGLYLHVALVPDAEVTALKGVDRPVMAASDRSRLIERLGLADRITVTEALDPRAFIARYRPNIWLKGPDYAMTSDFDEAEAVRSVGGTMLVLAGERKISTSQILG